MKVLLEKSKNQQMPIEIIYLSEKGLITQRTIIVNEVNENYMKAYCFTNQQIRLLKTGNILSAAMPKRKAKFA
jgi:predicted DNA-binding transcriptional regulator YafY